MKPTSEGELTFLEDAMILAKKSGQETILRKLKRYYKLYRLNDLISTIDRDLFNSTARNIYRKYRQPEWLSWRVILPGVNRPNE